YDHVDRCRRGVPVINDRLKIQQKSQVLYRLCNDRAVPYSETARPSVHPRSSPAATSALAETREKIPARESQTWAIIDPRHAVRTSRRLGDGIRLRGRVRLLSVQDPSRPALLRRRRSQPDRRFL